MDLMGYTVELEIKSLANEHAVNFQSGGSAASSSTKAPLQSIAANGPLIVQLLDDGCRYLYLVEVPNSPVFKLGTLKADHSRGRKTALDRFPPTPTCCDVKWDPTTLVLKHLVKTALQPDEPDVPIHERLRAAAKEEHLLDCGQTEFHDRALMSKCRWLMDELDIEKAGRSGRGGSS
jgi:hypothetical protein